MRPIGIAPAARSRSTTGASIGATASASAGTPEVVGVPARHLGEEAGRGGEAKEWRHQARVAERALGIGEFSDPEIVDFGVEEEVRPERRPRARDLVPPGSTGEGTEEDAATSVPAAEDTEGGQPEGDRPGGERAVGDDLAAEGLVVVDSRDDEAEGPAPWEDAVDDQPGQRPMTAPHADRDPQGD